MTGSSLRHASCVAHGKATLRCAPGAALTDAAEQPRAMSMTTIHTTSRKNTVSQPSRCWLKMELDAHRRALRRQRAGCQLLPRDPGPLRRIPSSDRLLNIFWIAAAVVTVTSFRRAWEAGHRRRSAGVRISTKVAVTTAERDRGQHLVRDAEERPEDVDPAERVDDALMYRK